MILKCRSRPRSAAVSPFMTGWRPPPPLQGSATPPQILLADPPSLLPGAVAPTLRSSRSRRLVPHTTPFLPHPMLGLEQKREISQAQEATAVKEQIPHGERTYLAVPYEERDQTKAIGWPVRLRHRPIPRLPTASPTWLADSRLRSNTNRWLRSTDG
jgi:hypothetical protein